MKDIPSSSRYMLIKEEAYEYIENNINNHITSLIHSHYILSWKDRNSIELQMYLQLGGR
jgi:hypothetical protein